MSRADKVKEQMEAESESAAETTPDVASTAGKELAESLDGFAALDIAHVGGTRYRVLSAGGDDVTAYTVDIADLSCDCPDTQYNKDDRAEAAVCKHLAKALLVAPSRQSVEAEAFDNLVSIVREAQTALDDIKDVRDVAQASQSANAAAGGSSSTASTESDESGGTDGGGSQADGGAGEAADRLQAAFDDVIDDMRVTANDGLVWFQTGAETPDDWPFPGGDDTFSVVTGPDAVMYVHDGSADWADSPHKHYDSKPGEWYKNALRPAQVDDYIAEVLE